MTTELLVVLAIAVLIFGSTRIPQLARSIGKARNELRHLESSAPE